MYAITGSGFQIATIVLCSQALLASALHENVTNQIVLVTAPCKMFAINNFREFREWSTFANIIIRELLYSHIHSIKLLEYTLL